MHKALTDADYDLLDEADSGGTRRMSAAACAGRSLGVPRRHRRTAGRARARRRRVYRANGGFHASAGRRLVHPNYHSEIERVGQALAALGKHLVVETA
ncbi:hypothetical protein [Nitrococcus mobilis]|uniref:Uncharacterized protein n=1 Tax=Nitrococcus mobilis Nb-231 TaxID=314278 RepID=A4BVJ9_9GAMM|nr:hypothetical protein [Nitrococcus mobilis]EAR20264.1 hypothetical protein NB231_12946 [Nitrococcus mobilis Nb-231]